MLSSSNEKNIFIWRDMGSIGAIAQYLRPPTARVVPHTSIPQYHGYGKAHHPPHHPTSTFSWRGGGCTSCTARAASSIPPYLILQTLVNCLVSNPCLF